MVIGLGNPLRGDDGVGVRVAEALAEQALPDDVEVVDGGTQGLGLVNLMEGRQRVILVDAADMGKAPGEFVRFTLDEVRLPGRGRALCRSTPPACATRCCWPRRSRCCPTRWSSLACSRPTWTGATSLSPEVEAALPKLVEAILEEAGSW